MLEEKSKQKTKKIDLLSFVLWVYLDTFKNIFTENLTFYLINSTIFVRTGLITASILLIPLTAMQFSESMNWSLFDFVFAGSLLFLAGIAVEFFMARTSNFYYRLAAALTVFTTIFLIASNEAVGIIGSEKEAFNLWYFGVAFLTILGSLISQFKPQAMSCTLFSAAGAQALITFAALSLGLQQIPGSSVTEILAVNGLFVALYLISGILFNKSKSSPKGFPARQEKLA